MTPPGEGTSIVGLLILIFKMILEILPRLKNINNAEVLIHLFSLYPDDDTHVKTHSYHSQTTY